MTINHNNIIIQLLTKCPQHITSLAKLLYQEIGKNWTPNASVEKASQRLINHLNEDKLPLAYAAIYDNQPVGIACLRENDGIWPGVTPWLGSLAVDPMFRKMKIGELLIESIKSQARIYGYQDLYLFAFDPTIPDWYKKLGWHSIGEDTLFGHRVEVMKITL